MSKIDGDGPDVPATTGGDRRSEKNIGQSR